MQLSCNCNCILQHWIDYEVNFLEVGLTFWIKITTKYKEKTVLLGRGRSCLFYILDTEGGHLTNLQYSSGKVFPWRDCVGWIISLFSLVFTQHRETTT